MVTVLSSPSIDHDILSIVSFEREGDFKDSMTWSEDGEVTMNSFPFLFQTKFSLEFLNEFLLNDLPSSMVEVLDHVKERRVIGIFNICQVIWYIVMLRWLGYG